MMGILGGVAAIVNLVCFIMVLIKLFQSEGVLMGILGLICGIYTFIWGWMKNEEQGIRQIMTYWTIAIVAQSILLGSSMTFS
ncbi:MAG: hypothetical protein ACI9EW_001595 [Cellvibrionaceae bacterium]|jgi:hypothetical protein